MLIGSRARVVFCEGDEGEYMAAGSDKAKPQQGGSSTKNIDLEIMPLSLDNLDAAVVLFIDTFTRAPWNDVYTNILQVRQYLNHYVHASTMDEADSVSTDDLEGGDEGRAAYAHLLPFFGFVARNKRTRQVVALCCGGVKPWLEGMEAYVDEFCVAPELQGQGVGSVFFAAVENILRQSGLNGLILHTNPSYGAYDFYQRCGMSPLEDQSVLAKIITTQA